MKRSLLFILVIVCFIIETNAQIIHIPSDLLTIQAGIDSAANGDTVLVAEGSYFENINFKGKAITVASHFILDGDTSHISRTIIDGSKSAKPDTASTVMMWSGEDTTSVLMGFTITGGTGTEHTYAPYGYNIRVGGGICITGSGGKITNNIIEKNHVKKAGSQDECYGGGIWALVYNNHSVIIRKNIIKGNKVTGLWAGGGGIEAVCGRILIEYNEIINNSLFGTDGSKGGGIDGNFFDVRDGVKYYEGVIHEAIVRNNNISGNSSDSENEYFGGGGYAQSRGYGEENIQVYNNIICTNHTNTCYGGLFLANDSEGRFFNNTIVNNTAGWGVNCYGVWFGKNLSLYNNILWHYGSSGSSSEYDISISDDARVLAFNNIIMYPFGEMEQLTAFNNLNTEPVFQPGSYELAEGSPGIGWGLDSAKIDSKWYYAPSFDLYGNPRPHPIDGGVDPGAIESEFPRPVYHTANLNYIGLWDRKLWPEFHKDTLHYILPVPDTALITPQLDFIPEDWLADIDINNANDIGSPDPADRTTTITVTATDGYTQKTYTVLFRYETSDSKLYDLSITKGTLVPEFHSDSLVYTVCLPKYQITAPEVLYDLTDSNATATVNITYAPYITVQTPGPQKRPYRTTVITVISEDGTDTTVYEIEHLINKTIPLLTLISDTVILNENIEVTSTEDGYIYLVPRYTSRNLDSILVHRVDSTVVTAGVTAHIDTAVCGTYWLYAIENCLNISSPVTITIIDTLRIGISGNKFKAIRLYPVPADRILYIETSRTITSVELFNVIGIKVMDKPKPEGRIDMGHLEQGIYFIRIKTDLGEVYTGKVIKR
jgi:hypothetical protein